MKSLFTFIFPLLILNAPLFANPQGQGHLAASAKVQNLETELNYLKQRISNQETTIDHLRDEVSSLLKAMKEVQAKSHETQDGRLNKMEKSLDKVVQDLKQFKTHSNETNALIDDVKKALSKQGQISDLQNKELKDFEKALKSLAQAMQKNIGLSSFKSSSDGSYRVQSGDTLEKIAKDLKVSISELKAVNSLKSDKIQVGQELRIP